MAEIKIFEQYKQFFRDDYRYNVVHGGRGKGASWNIARGLLAISCQDKRRILCTREFQNSINESVYHVLTEQIDLLGLQANFSIQKNSITSLTGSEFIFKGLRHNVDSIKSMEGITDVWVAEADKVPHDSWDKLIPTIRTKDSKFFIDFNTDTEDDPVYKMFVSHKRDDAHVIFQTYKDNPFFPDVLRKEMEYDRTYNHDKYLWVWEGMPRSFSEACVFSGKYEIDDFTTPEDAHFMHGADWGFAHDPLVLIRCFEKNDYLYVDQEVSAVGVEIDEHQKLFDAIPTSKDWPIIADSARPEIISYMKKRGYRITPAKKGKGSIIAGIDRLKNFKKIIVHPRCKRTIEELKLYSYKRNPTTGDVMPILIDDHNHVIDSLRYATEKYKKKQPTSGNISLESLGL